MSTHGRPLQGSAILFAGDFSLLKGRYKVCWGSPLLPCAPAAYSHLHTYCTPGLALSLSVGILFCLILLLRAASFPGLLFCLGLAHFSLSAWLFTLHTGSFLLLDSYLNFLWILEQEGHLRHFLKRDERRALMCAVGACNTVSVNSEAPRL